MQMSSQNQPTVIILMGPPGSGKGTQAKEISIKKGLPHISTGDLFRENMNRDTQLGLEAKGYINQGQLVPDTLVLKMLYERVSKEDCKEGYLLDGFPRTIPQAQSLDAALGSSAHVIVLNLNVPDEVVIKRISGRLSCSICGNIQNLYYSAPLMEGKCDQCGGELQQRADDKVEVVKERLKSYEKQTSPLVGYYEKKGILYQVDGARNSEIIKKELLEILNEKGIKS